MPLTGAGQAGGGAAPEARGEGRRALGLERPAGSGQRARTARPFLFLAHLPSSSLPGVGGPGSRRWGARGRRGRALGVEEPGRWVCVRLSPAAPPAPRRRRSSRGPGAPARGGGRRARRCGRGALRPGGSALLRPGRARRRGAPSGLRGGASAFHLESPGVPREPGAGGRGAGRAPGLRGRPAARMHSLLAQDQSHRCSLCVRSGFVALGLSMET